MTDRPFLTTERFELWQPRLGDLEGLCRLVEDEETRRYLGPIKPEPQAQWDRLMRNTGGWALYGYGIFPVRVPGSDEIIANCGVFHSWRGLGHGMDDQPEAGWIVRRDWWGKGLASEVMRAALGWFDQTQGARRVVCMIEAGNVGSEKVAAMFGFAHYDAMVAEDDGALINFYERLPG